MSLKSYLTVILVLRDGGLDSSHAVASPLTLYDPIFQGVGANRNTSLRCMTDQSIETLCAFNSSRSPAGVCQAIDSNSPPEDLPPPCSPHHCLLHLGRHNIHSSVVWHQCTLHCHPMWPTPCVPRSRELNHWKGVVDCQPRLGYLHVRPGCGQCLDTPDVHTPQNWRHSYLRYGLPVRSHLLPLTFPRAV